MIKAIVECLHPWYPYPAIWYFCIVALPFHHISSNITEESVFHIISCSYLRSTVRRSEMSPWHCSSIWFMYYMKCRYICVKGLDLMYPIYFNQEIILSRGWQGTQISIQPEKGILIHACVSILPHCPWKWALCRMESPPPPTTTTTTTTTTPEICKGLGYQLFMIQQFCSSILTWA